MGHVNEGRDINKPGNQYRFFQHVCLDENGLLCGIQDVINGLNSLVTVVSGNTDAINDIRIGLDNIGNEVVEINTNLEDLNELVTNIDANVTMIEDCVCNTNVICPPIHRPPVCNIIKTIVCDTTKRTCNIIIKTKQTPTYINVCNQVLTISTINGFSVVTSSRHPTPRKASKANPKSMPNLYLDIQGQTVGEINTNDIPQLIVPKGYRLPDGTFTCIVPRLYKDSNGKVIKARKEFIGKPNKSVCYK
jgi:hypothetical protein